MARLLCLVLLCSPVWAELRLGVHAEEPAPAIGALLAELTPASQPITIRAYQSTGQVVAALRAGEVELGIIEDSGSQLPGLALVADLYPSVLHMLHRDSELPIDPGSLLTLGPVWAGAPESQGYRLAEALAGDFGASPEAVNLLPDPWSIDPFVYFIFGGILSDEALARLQGFTLYSLDSAESGIRGSVAEAVALRYPYLRPFVLPAQLYPSLDREPALTLSLTNILVAQQDVDPEAIYQLSMDLERMRPRIEAAYPLAGISRLTDRELPQALPLHEGAARYRDRDLPGFIERYAEVFALGITLFVTASSILIALRRQRRQSRKDRLDEYYRRLLGLREQLTVADSDRDAIAHRIRSTQAEVMNLVIDERIDASLPLLAFLTLSNRLLDEAGTR